MAANPVKIPWVSGAVFLKVVCRIGEPRPDATDVDTYPELNTQSGTVTLSCDAAKIRYRETDGRYRMLTMREWTFFIRSSDGELVNNADNTVGVYILSARTPEIGRASCRERV